MLAAALELDFDGSRPSDVTEPGGTRQEVPAAETALGRPAPITPAAERRESRQQDCRQPRRCHLNVVHTYTERMATLCGRGTEAVDSCGPRGYSRLIWDVVCQVEGEAAPPPSSWPPFVTG